MATRSLGTLTLNLVAEIGGFAQGMDKAERRAQKWRNEVKKSAEQAGKAFAAGAAVVTGALAAMAVQTVRSAAEIERLSAVSNTSAQEFQRYAAGARTAGIEQEKLADIFKDTTDRVGDFLQTGGGPMADFFENIAPQVGVTAEQFRNLSGPQALGLYVDSLEKANVSQSEMTFYMEAMASDATLLLPLLRNNAEGFRLMGDEAARAGAILDEDTLKASRELNASFQLMQLGAEGIKNQIAAELLPVLSSFASELTDIASDGTAAAAVGEGLAEVMRQLAKAAVGVVATFDLAGSSIGALAAAASAADIDPLENPIESTRKLIDNFDQVKSALTVGFVDINEKALEYAATLDRISNAGLNANGEEAVNERVQRLAELMNQVREQQSALGKEQARTFQEKEKQTEAEEAAAKASEDALKQQMEIQQDYQSLLRDLRTDEEVLTDQVRERLAVLEAVSDLTDEQRNQTLGRIAGAATADAPEFSGGDTTEAQAELEDWYATQLELLEDFRKERADLNATWDEEELAIRQEYEERLTEITQENEALRNQQMLDGYSAILGVVGKFYEGMEGEEAAYTRAAIAIGQTLLDEKKRNALQSIIASTQSAAMGAYEALASIPYVGPFLGAAAAGAVYVTGALAAAEVTGMAHDGIDSVPEDGTWLLQQGERVTTSETSAKLDRTLDRIEQGMGSGGAGMSRGSNTYNFNVAGNLNRETATQAARESERKQRMTTRRLGA